MIDLLITGGTVVTMDPQRRIITDGAVAVDGGRILAVDKAAVVAAQYPAVRETIDARGHLVTPGLIDGHNHPIHFLSKGICDDQEYFFRSHHRVWPYEVSLTPDEAYFASLGSFAEMVHSGTTCFASPGDFYPLEVARAANTVSIRGTIARIGWDRHDPNAPERFNETWEEAAARGEEAAHAVNAAGGGRLRGWLSLVRSAHCSDRLCQEIKRRADRMGTMIHGHMCVLPGEAELSLRTFGARSLERYRRLGVLGPNLYLVHMGWITDEEVDLVREHGVKVCHCPSASMLGGFGCITHGKFPELIAAGVTVALGSDACAISRFVDMVRVMYLAACAHKDVKHDPTVMGPHKAFEMCTIDGARALGWDDEIGSLEPGKRADIAVFATDAIEWQPQPFATPVANLVLSASGAACRHVIIDGRVVMRDRRLLTIDLDAYLCDAAQRAPAILNRLNIPVAPAWPVV
ncbi:MAG: amidohydrolase family protein [Armatimonadetes bacterium]|nr:amidohydrolase family protein [Armatimonadota bacterium]